METVPLPPKTLQNRRFPAMARLFCCRYFSPLGSLVLGKNEKVKSSRENQRKDISCRAVQKTGNENIYFHNIEIIQYVGVFRA